jgi:hypothetical protein
VNNLRTIASVLVLACAGCSSVETAHGPGYVLKSPYGRESTDAWSKRVDGELAATAAFLGRPIPDPPLDVRLDRIDAGQFVEGLRLEPSVDGKEGWTIGGHEVHVFVDTENDGMYSTSTDGVLRHEFVHALLHHAGITGPAWLHEGLAHEVEYAVNGAGGLRLDPAPVHLLVARECAKTFDVSRVWSWSGTPETTRDDQSALRVLSRSFVRFLVERDGDAWRGRVAEWAALRPADDPSLVSAWRTWLDETSFVGRIERGTRDPDAAVRRHAANTLPSLAENAPAFHDHFPGLAAEIGPSTDALAMALLASDDSQCAEAAARYFVYFRRDALTDADVRGLAARASPAWTRITGLALVARRGGHVDPADANATWARLSEFDQMIFQWLAAWLPIERRPPRAARVSR